jgi:hypothetical protein
VRASILLAALVLFFSVSTSPQDVEHAPTVAQCQADQALWLSTLEDEHTADNVIFPTLQAWEHEMNQCTSVDPPNHNKYYNTWSEAIADESLREYRFIKRHGLLDKFVAEDAAGKR